MPEIQPTRRERLSVAALAFVATAVFFYEYLPPFKRVHLYSDIEGYHYPLQYYAFQVLRTHHLPLWDASIYCGISFIGNIQVALFYPVSWLMHLAAWGRPYLPFKFLECFVMAHSWIAFLLAYLWLRGRSLAGVASALGAAVLAYGGYLISQSWHPGVVSGLAWMPLGLWGIDEAVTLRDWRPLWKTAVASAMCFLAGYPPTWVVFCAASMVYAIFSPGRWRAALGLVAAVAASLLLSAVQLLPSLQARSLMEPSGKYGGGIAEWRGLLPLFVANWFDFNFESPSPYPPYFYLYLGLPALVAFAWLARGRNFRIYAQPLAVLGFCLLMAVNPRNWIAQVIEAFPAIDNVTQSHNFYEGIAVMAALITALAVHDLLKTPSRLRLPAWVGVAAAIALGVRAVWQLRIWRGGHLAVGPRAAIETAIGAILVATLLWSLRSASNRRRAALSAALLLAVGVDYKVFGTSRRFNAVRGDLDLLHPSSGIRGMNHPSYLAVTGNRHYRIASDELGGPDGTAYRFWNLATPQGFDPFLPAQYRAYIEHWVPFRTNRLFYFDFDRADMLQGLGVRFVIAHGGVSNDARFAASPDYRMLGPPDSFYRVYEFLKARPPYGWDGPPGEGRPVEWTPEHRAFEVASDQGGAFYLMEQFFPGWTASVDGHPVPVDRWRRTFQSVRVPPGRHRLVFEYRVPFFSIAIALSIATAAALLAIALDDRRRRQLRARP